MEEARPEERKAPKREGSGGSSGTSGIGTGASSDASSDHGSDSRRGVVRGGGASLLSLCERGEWLLLDQRLRNLEKGSPQVSAADLEV